MELDILVVYREGSKRWQYRLKLPSNTRTKKAVDQLNAYNTFYAHELALANKDRHRYCSFTPFHEAEAMKIVNNPMEVDIERLFREIGYSPKKGWT